jgi:CRISPR-associated protein Cmr4
MNSSNAILGLFTETSLHAGAGQALGVIDLPIQREAHTNWPCVYGSAVKGALRARAETDRDSEKRLQPEEISLIFGQADFKPGESSEYAGTLAVGDARLLLLPVRSLTTHFRWVTCPAALKRFLRDSERLGLRREIGGFDVPDLTDTRAALVVEAVGEWLFLEEYRFRADESKAEKLAKIVDALAKLMPDGLGDALRKQIAIVADAHFRHLAEHATPVNAHVRLDDKKTVAKGALWYEETLPPETLLYVGLNAVASRHKDGETKLTADAVMTRLRESLFGEYPYLQLGGNETVGMGWCWVSCLSAGKPESSHKEVRPRSDAAAQIGEQDTGRLPSMALDSGVHGRNDVAHPGAAALDVRNSGKGG